MIVARFPWTKVPSSCDASILWSYHKDAGLGGVLGYQAVQLMLPTLMLEDTLFHVIYAASARAILGSS